MDQHQNCNGNSIGSVMGVSEGVVLCFLKTLTFVLLWQPFCDGSHNRCAPEISPLRFKLEEAKEAWLCGCKYTKNPPYCDGTHKEDFVQKADLHSHPQLC